MSTVPANRSSDSAVPQVAATIDARIDALPKVALNRAAAAGLMLCYLFANYDISVFAITIPSVADNFGAAGASLAWPVTLNLIGFAAGAYAFGNLADRRGRRAGLFVTVFVLGLGGFLGAFSWDMTSFTIFRFITGCGMGAVLALGSTYIGEMAPPSQRGRYLAWVYTCQAVLITAIGFASLTILEVMPTGGWRILIGFGALVWLVLPMINDRMMHESPRWLNEHGQHEHADRLVTRMEQRLGVTAAETLGATENPSAPSAAALSEKEPEVPVRALFRPPYRRRMAIILGFWFIYYIGSYSWLSYTPLILSKLGASDTNALFVTVAGRIAGIVIPITMLLLIERLERRLLIHIGGGLFILGLLFLIIDPGNVTLSLIGSMTIVLGYDTIIIPAYMYTSEMFPTRARGTASAVGDGIGHLGGAVAPLIILPVLYNLGGVAAVFVMIATNLIAAGIIAMGPRTKKRPLTEIAH